MADFNPPFGDSSAKRLPTTDEQENGFPCGPADQELFNGMFHRVESEIGEVIRQGGLTQTNTDMTQLRQAIQAMIAAATGGGNTSQFLLLSQASTRLPIFPEILSSDGKMYVVAPILGTIRVPANVNFMHRGISPVTTTETDFNTDASKTYHVRWNPTDGYTLNDVTGTTYNPSSLVETNEAFDSTYDDMLIARVVTNSSNVATITNLANKSRLSFNGIIEGQNYRSPGSNAARADFQQTIDWARTPEFKSFNLSNHLWQPNANGTGDHDFDIYEFGHVSGSTTGSVGLNQYPVDRYETKFAVGYDNSTRIRYDLSLLA